MKARLRRLFFEGVSALAEMPLSLRIVLFAIAVLHGTALSWGMPSSHAWDNDGVAPRDFLPGLASTFTPGQFYTYPPFHLALLALLSAPVTILAVINAGSTSVPVVLKEILDPSYMTAMAMIARITCLLMSLGLVIAIAKIAEEISPPQHKKRAALGTAMVAGVGMPFTYYSHTSNLDVPYLFWAGLSALELVRAIGRHEPRRIRRAFLFAVFAIATKDQAYALYLLGAPLLLLAWLALDRRARTEWRTIAKDVAIGGAIAVALLLLIDGAITNPSGFRRRVAFLSGSASQDYATYLANMTGRLRILKDLVWEVGRHYPYPEAFDVLYVAGLVIAVRSAPSRAAALVPFALSLSFSVAFNLVARRVEERFTLPQIIFLAIYAGVALGRVFDAPQRAVRWPLGALAAALLLRALFWAVELDVNLLYDPRYDAEDFLAKNVKPHETIEVHGLNVYLPRLPPGRRAVRVGHTPVNKRNPIPGLEEVQAKLVDIDERKPEWVVVSECYTWRFFSEKINDEGRVRPVAQERDANDEDAFWMFARLFDLQHGYRWVHVSQWESNFWGKIDLHASVSCKNTIFRRQDPP